MAKDRIERDELASKLLEETAGAEDPRRRIAEMVRGFLMEAEGTSEGGGRAA